MNIRVAVILISCFAISMVANAVDYTCDEEWHSSQSFDGRNIGVLVMGSVGTNPQGQPYSLYMRVIVGHIAEGKQMSKHEPWPTNYTSNYCIYVAKYDSALQKIDYSRTWVKGTESELNTSIQTVLDAGGVPKGIKRILEAQLAGQNLTFVGEYAEDRYTNNKTDDVSIADMNEYAPTDYNDPGETNEELANLVKTIKSGTNEIRYYAAITAIATSVMVGVQLFRIAVLGKNQRSVW